MQNRMKPPTVVLKYPCHITTKADKQRYFDDVYTPVKEEADALYKKNLKIEDDYFRGIKRGD